MSRGPGRIERAIYDLFADHPEGAWTTEDLCRLIYPTANRVEKKHRVAVLRAIKTIMNKTDDDKAYRGLINWTCWQAETTGHSLVLFDHANIMSYSLARLKVDFCYSYAAVRVRGYKRATEEELLEQLQPGGRSHDHIVPGGAWHRHVQQYIAERDGDQETAEKLAAEQERSTAMIFSKFHKKRANR